MDDLIPRAAARDVINTWGRQENEDVRMDLLHNDMNAIPAVDAIPVAWLKSIKETMMRQNRAETCVLARVIEMWEKEQGRENDEQG